MESLCCHRGMKSHWALQDTHWSRGFSYTLTANGTCQMIHSEKHSLCLIIWLARPSGNPILLVLGNTAPVSVSAWSMALSRKE